jgi:hypothetical protein
MVITSESQPSVDSNVVDIKENILEKNNLDNDSDSAA